MYIRDHRYDAKCDVWSIGCILWDMANTANTFIFVSHLYVFPQHYSLCACEDLDGGGEGPRGVKLHVHVCHINLLL